MSLFTVPTNDYVSHMMGMVFGSAWSTVQSLGLGAASSNSSATGYLGQMFLIYNTAILTVVTIYITKVLFEGAVGTAHKGEWFGKMYSTFWMPLRMFLMLGMLAPVLGGYCFGQVAVLFAVNTGIGVADDLANTGISAVIKTGVVSPPANVPSQRSTVNTLFLQQTCLAIIANDPEYANTGTSPVSVQTVGSGTVELGGTSATGLSQTACGTINTAGLNSSQMSALSTLESTITGMTASAQPIGAIMTRVYGSQGTGSGNTSNLSNGGSPLFTVAQNNLLTNAASTFEQSLYSVVASPSTSGMTGQWTNAVQTYGFGALAPLMLDISMYDANLSAQVGAGPIVTPPDATFTQSGNNAMAMAERYISAHNTTPVTSPAVNPFGGNSSQEIMQLPQDPSSSELLTDPLDYMEGTLNYYMTKNTMIPLMLLFNTNAQGINSANPLGVVQNMGQNILNVGTGTFVGLMGMDGIATIAAVAGGGKVLGNGINSTPIAIFLGTFILTIIGTVVLPIILFGLLAAYIIPMMPYTVMIMAIIGYVAAVAVAMVGAPLWIASHAIPTGEGFVSDRSKAGYNLLLSLFAKPPLIVFGFFLALAMFGAGMWLINETFFSAVSVVMSGTTSGNAVMLAIPVLDIVGLLAMMAGFITMLFILISLYITLAKWSFGLIHYIPDNALSWIGLQDISMHEEDKHNEALIVGAYAAAQTGRGAIASARSAVQQRNSAVQQQGSDKVRADAIKNASKSNAGGEYKFNDGGASSVEPLFKDGYLNNPTGFADDNPHSYGTRE